MKPKKNTRQRGGKTHGWGSKKKHRGAGNRGGRGNAGSGKRGDQKKPSYWNAAKPQKGGQKRGQPYFGKIGFGMTSRKTLIAVTVRDVDTQVDRLVAEGQATVKAGVYTLDLTALGYAKLLGTGQITRKVNITVAAATAGAIEKVKAAGGDVKVDTAI